MLDLIVGLGFLAIVVAVLVRSFSLAGQRSEAWAAREEIANRAMREYEREREGTRIIEREERKKLLREKIRRAEKMKNITGE